MARKSDGVPVIILLIAVVGAILIKIFEFIVEHFLIIVSVILFGIVVLLVINYFKENEIKIQKELDQKLEIEKQKKAEKENFENKIQIETIVNRNKEIEVEKQKKNEEERLKQKLEIDNIVKRNKETVLRKFHENRDERLKQQLEIENIIKRNKETVLREFYENQLKLIEEEYLKKSTEIEKSKINILFKLDNIEIESEKEELKLDDEKNTYDPFQSISKLSNILKSKENNYDIIWDLFYDKSEYPLKSPREIFEHQVSNLNLINPIFFEIKNLEEGQNQNDKLIEIKKQEYNEVLKSIHKSSSEIIFKRIDELRQKYTNEEKIWKINIEEFESEKSKKNKKIDSLKSKYFKKDTKAIISFYNLLFNEIVYDLNFHKSINIEYFEENKMLFVEYLLPSIEHFPNIKEYRYLKTLLSDKN